MRLALLAEAEAELDDAATWYDDRSEGLGDELMAVAREAMSVVRDPVLRPRFSPHQAPPAHARLLVRVPTRRTWALWPGVPARIPPIRRFMMPRFPYAIAYQAFPGFLVVLAIAHERRKPFYWIGRAR